MQVGQQITIDEPRASSDQEYSHGDLPAGWLRARVTDLVEIIRGVSYAKGEAAPRAEAGRVALLRANNIGDGLNFNDLQYVPEHRVAPEQMLRPGDVVIAMSSGSKSVVGKAATLAREWTGTFGAFCGVLRPRRGLDPAYIALFFQTKEYRTLISEASAGTNINNLKREYFDAISVAIPPLAEQKRIVAKVEAVLARVNAVRERLAKVPAILKRFRQSVLAAACSGRLTAEHREEHPDGDALDLIRSIAVAKRVTIPADAASGAPELPNGWVRTTLGFLTELGGNGRPFITSGSRGWADYVGNTGRFFIRSENINTEYLRLEEAVRVNPPAGAEADRTLVRPGDLLLTITGNNVGRTAVVPTACPAAHVSQHVAIIRVTPLIDVTYLWLWLRSIEHGQGQLRSHFYGYTKPGLNLEQIRNVEVNLPPIDEQRDIVRRVYELFDLAFKVELRVQLSAARTQALTQATLSKAFRGELVEREAELAAREGRDFETAAQLLSRIRASQQTAPAKPRPRRPRKITASKP